MRRKPKYKLTEDDRKILWYEIGFIEKAIDGLAEDSVKNIPHNLGVLKAKHLQLSKTFMAFFEPDYNTATDTRQGIEI